MHSLLMILTTFSLALAAGMAVVIVKLLREDRERSAARVAALTAMAEHPAAVPEDILRPRPATEPGQPHQRAAIDIVPITDHAGQPGEWELGTSPAGTEWAGSDLFAQPESPSPWGRRLAVAGALVVLLSAAVFLATTGRGAADASRAQAGAPAGNAPLELVALRHSRDGQTLTISGLVQNPRNGTPLVHLVATAFAFAPDGAFLTSSRAPLDTITLAPGEESPFVVKVTVSGDVARYRISFRTEDGRVIAHVDKRSPDTLASKQEQP